MRHTVLRRRPAARVPRLPWAALAVSVGVALPPVPATAQTPWWPVQIDAWTPPFNAEHKRERKSFVPPAAASKPWRICAVIPHLKDDYWLAVDYGLIDEAKRLGVSLELYEAGGYENLNVQRQQIADCITKAVDALIIGGVSATGLDDMVATAAAAGTPVIDLINGMKSDKIAARVAADFYDMGFAAGSYLKTLQADRGTPLKIGWFPGPSGAGWVADGDKGFRAALEGTGAVIIDGGFGDTGLAAQSRLVQEVVAAHPDIDIVAGTAVTADAAVQVLQRQKLADHARIVSYYFGPAVSRAIKRGLVLAAPSDRQALLARMAVDQAVSLLDKKPIDRHIAATITMVDTRTIEGFDMSSSIAPLGFRPVFSVGP
jgi:protein TorT